VIYISNCSILSQELDNIQSLSQLVILCTGQAKPYCTQNIHSQFTYDGPFTCSPMYRISSKQCDPYVKTFSTLSVKYSLHKCNEIMLCQK